jgi:hypothetical protein
VTWELSERSLEDAEKTTFMLHLMKNRFAWGSTNVTDKGKALMVMQQVGN